MTAERLRARVINSRSTQSCARCRRVQKTQLNSKDLLQSWSSPAVKHSSCIYKWSSPSFSQGVSYSAAIGTIFPLSMLKCGHILEKLSKSNKTNTDFITTVISRSRALTFLSKCKTWRLMERTALTKMVQANWKGKAWAGIHAFLTVNTLDCSQSSPH